MIRKLSFFIGLGTGYVLGAKAGEQRYQEIVAKAREIAGMPAVQEAASTIAATAATVTDTVTDKVQEKAGSVLGGKDAIDLTAANGSSQPGSRGSAADAAASGSASSVTKP